jgi:hypothetical protein
VVAFRARGRLPDRAAGRHSVAMALMAASTAGCVRARRPRSGGHRPRGRPPGRGRCGTCSWRGPIARLAAARGDSKIGADVGAPTSRVPRNRGPNRRIGAALSGLFPRPKNSPPGRLRRPPSGLAPSPVPGYPRHEAGLCGQICRVAATVIPEFREAENPGPRTRGEAGTPGPGYRVERYRARPA